MRRQLLPSALTLIIFTVLLGAVYPLVVTGIAQGLFKGNADGQLVYRHGKPVGSQLIGQAFADKDGNPIPKYFQSRPSSAAGVSGKTSNGYDPTLSGGSNLGPSNPLLVGFQLLANVHCHDFTNYVRLRNTPLTTLGLV